MNNSIHIVSFDYPYPPDYGGIIDVFYKMKALHENGININLHYFAEEEKKHSELDKICNNIFYYPKTSIISTQFLSKLPMRMLLRSNKNILNNLLKDDAPILFEGLHSSYIAKAPELANRKKFLRCHNAEAEYAKNISKVESNYLKRKIFDIEAKRTAAFEKDLSHFTGLFVLSEKDKLYFDNSNENVKLLPIFHQDSGIDVQEGLGDYILFHGNLSVNENIDTARWIAREIAPQFWDFNFVVAGKNPSQKLQNEINDQNIECIPNPSKDKMGELVKNSQIILLKTAVPSGIKLKLIDSLSKGRHIISDENTILSSGLENLVHIAEGNQAVKIEIRKLMHVEVNDSNINLRIKLFNQILDNKQNIQKLISEIFG